MKNASVSALSAPARSAADVEGFFYAVAAIAALAVLASLYVVAPAMHILASPPLSYGVLMVVAVYFATHTLLRPQSALLYAPLFMVLATTIVPQSVPVWGNGAPRQYYFWALGLFFITSALVLRLPWRSLLRVGERRETPFFLTAFFAVCVAASFQGLRLGFGPSYVIRQLYGALLFVIYFYAVLVLPTRKSEIVGFLNILKWFGIGASLYTIIRYAGAVKYADVGSFKWGLSIYCAMLAVYCMAEAATAKGLRNRLWLGLQATLLIANPVVFQARAATGVAAVAGGLAFVMLIRSKRVKTMVTTITLAVAVGAIVADFIAPIDEFLPHIGNAANLVPKNILTQPSFVGRVNEVLGALRVMRVHPLLGAGLGSTLTFLSPGGATTVTMHPVDVGFAYVLSKLGLLGLVSFYGLVVSVLWHSGWPEPDLLHVAAFTLFVFCVAFMFSHPDMLQFIVAGFAGMVCGLLHRAGSFKGREGGLAPRGRPCLRTPPPNLRAATHPPSSIGQKPW